MTSDPGLLFTEKKDATLKIQAFPPQPKAKRGKCEEALRDRCLWMLIAVFISSKDQRIKRQRQQKSGDKQIKKAFQMSHPFAFSDGKRESWEVDGGLSFVQATWISHHDSSNKVLCLFSASLWIHFFHYRNQSKRWKGKSLFLDRKSSWMQFSFCFN